MDLSPCPFCGEESSLVVTADRLVHFGGCMTCGARGPVAEDRQQAIANWDRRPTSTLEPAADDYNPLRDGGPWNGGRVWTMDGKPIVMPGGPLTDELAAARERREEQGLPSVTTTANPSGVGMDFDLGGPPPAKPPRR